MTAAENAAQSTKNRTEVLIQSTYSQLVSRSVTNMLILTTYDHFQPFDQVQGGREEGAGGLPLFRPQQGQLLRDRRKRLPLLLSRQGGKGECII